MYGSLKLTVGAFEVELTMDDELKGATLEHQSRKLAELMFMSHKAYRLYEGWTKDDPISSPLPALAPETPAPAPAPEPRSFQRPLTGYVPVPVVKIVRGFDGTKETTKIYGGEWTKHGVFAYSDSCRDLAGIFSLPLGTHEGEAVKGLIASIVVKGDSPVKVSEVRKDVPVSQSA